VELVVGEGGTKNKEGRTSVNYMDKGRFVDGGHPVELKGVTSSSRAV